MTYLIQGIWVDFNEEYIDIQLEFPGWPTSVILT